MPIDDSDLDPKSLKASALAAHLSEIDRLVADACRRNGLDASIHADDATFRAVAFRGGMADDDDEPVPHVDPLGDLTDEERDAINNAAHELGPDGLQVARQAVGEFRALHGAFCGVLGATPRTLGRFIAAHPSMLALRGEMNVR